MRLLVTDAAAQPPRQATAWLIMTLGRIEPCLSGLQRSTGCMSLKQNAIQVIGALPEDASYEAVSEELAILSALDEAEGDIRAGRVISHEEIKKRLSSWISN